MIILYWSTFLFVVRALPLRTDYYDEAFMAQISDELDYVHPTNHTNFLKKKLAAKDAEMRNVVAAKDAEMRNVVAAKDGQIKNLTEEIGKLKTEKNSTDYELKRIKAPLAVRERIEFCEIMLSPAYKQTKQFLKSEEEVGFHEKRWIFILTKRTDEPFVKALLDFIERNKHRGLTIRIFARRIAGFFHFSSNKIHVPSLESYSERELKTELAAFFGAAFDNLTYDIVSTLRYENITNVGAVESIQNTSVTLSALPCP